MNKTRLFAFLLLGIIVIDISLVLVFLNGTKSWVFESNSSQVYTIKKEKFDETKQDGTATDSSELGQQKPQK